MQLAQPISVKQAAEILNCTYKGDGEILINGINEIHKVTTGDLTFVDVPKYYVKALNSAATVILINQETDFPEGKALIISQEPFTDFNKLVNHFRSEEKPAKYSHWNKFRFGGWDKG
ncbi:MAG: hypothetical protein EOP53_05975 [Sphingobacteriales bacterium]|nr:MAG: hypothetical protein EOP53_05975 [Sphingobacteriales bacterium]